jgi:TolA-binding protein
MNDGVVSIESIGTGDIMVEYISQELSGMNDNAFKDMEIPIEGGHIEDAVRSSRLHKLEQERRDLLDELTSLKESHIYTQHELSTTHNELQKLKEKSLQDMTSLNDQLHQFEYENKSLKERNIYNEKQLESVIDQYELKITELTESKDIIARELRVLQGKAHDHHEDEMKQLNLEKTIKRLERKISQQEDEERLGVTLYDRIHKYHELVQNNKELLEENKILRSRIENVELLTHQIQSLRGKCSRLEGEKINYQNLQTENQVHTPHVSSLLYLSLLHYSYSRKSYSIMKEEGMIVGIVKAEVHWCKYNVM